MPAHLRPYFELTFILCFPICSYCHAEQDFESDAKECSDGWYLAMAVAIHEAGWIIPEQQVAACAACATARGLKHDPGRIRNDEDGIAASVVNEYRA